MDEEDLFQLLCISPSATDQEVKKAYRKKALTCHPDKCDGPDAAQLFGKYKKAAEVLLDPEARKSYEKVLHAREERQERDNSLDSTRKKFKSDLEAREKAFDKGIKQEFDDKAKLAAEIERLQREGSRELEKENKKLKKLIAQELASKSSSKIVSQPPKPGFQVKVSWRHQPEDLTEQQVLEKLRMFGRISNSFLSSRRRRGIVEFVDKLAVESVINSQPLRDFKITRLFDVSKPTPVSECSLTPSNPPSYSMPPSFGTSDFEGGLLEQLKRKVQE